MYAAAFLSSHIFFFSFFFSYVSFANAVEILTIYYDLAKEIAKL